MIYDVETFLIFPLNKFLNVNFILNKNIKNITTSRSHKRCRKRYGKQCRNLCRIL